MSSSTSAGRVGSVLGDRYELIRHIARGGMSDVYEGLDRLLQRPVAVKIYRGSAPTDRSRFDAEVVTLAALNHPGLVQVYDAGEWGDDGYVVLELIDGPTLRSVLEERGALPPTEVAALGSRVADSLAFVHGAGVVHRDVTPSNVLCGQDGRPRLADFGIARLLDTSRLTATATAIGTPAYMAPEQVQGHDVSPAADIYSLGLVLLEALTGSAAFTGSSYEVGIARLVRDPEVGEGVPEAWRPLLQEMTAREAEDRPPANVVSDRLAALEGNASAAPVAAPPTAVVGSGEVDGQAATEVVAAAGGTTVMPAVLLSDPPAPTSTDEGPSRRPLWLALAAAAVVAALIASQGGGGIEVPTTTTTEPVAVTVAPTTTTTVPPTTTEPPPEARGKGKGRGGERDD